MRNEFIIGSFLLMAGLGALAYFVSPHFLWAFILIGPILLLGFYDFFQTKHAIMRNFPVLGRTRYVMEWFRPKIYQYFIESDTNGQPFNRLSRSIVYQRAKGVLDSNPFGTQLEVYAEGYEWLNHSIASLDPHTLNAEPRIRVGGKDCKQPYDCSIYNISAMSFGSLSKAAVMALNGGAKIGKFAHNTGEGGISPYHDKFEGDLIYQIGTGYFGCRSKDGNFDDDLYVERTKADNVKMIELKLSQGAKPGHGGILPARKNTPEIAKIRSIEPGMDVLSPPYHKAFNTPIELLQLIKKMRDLSGGKPVGFKLCVGRPSEIFSLCKAMKETGISPDFISVDGGEGGTGAAPLEFSNSVGMPFKEGLSFVHDVLVGFGLKKEIKLITAGKIVSGFHIFRALALGADICYSARGMMMALGCIQALECNKNTCPVGVTTQDPELVKGLVVGDKKVRVANFHRETVHSFVELLAAAGLKHPDQVNRSHINKRVWMNKVMQFNEIYPYVKENCMLSLDTCPEQYKSMWQEASAESFQPKNLV